MLLICVDVKLIYSSQNDLVPLPQKNGDDEFNIGLFIKSQRKIKQAKFFAAISTRQ